MLQNRFSADNALWIWEHSVTSLWAGGEELPGSEVWYLGFRGEATESLVKAPLGSTCDSPICRASRRLLRSPHTLLFLLPDPEDWRVSVLSATDPVLDSLHTPDAYLVLLASGLLISWCVKESPEGLFKPSNWGHTPRCLGSEHLGWGPRFCISNQLPGDVDVPGAETSLGSSSALRKWYTDLSTGFQASYLHINSSPQTSFIFLGNIVQGKLPPNI